MLGDGVAAAVVEAEDTEEEEEEEEDIEDARSASSSSSSSSSPISPKRRAVPPPLGTLRVRISAGDKDDDDDWLACELALEAKEPPMRCSWQPVSKLWQRLSSIASSMGSSPLSSSPDGAGGGCDEGVGVYIG